jgi:putative transposase
MKTVAEVIGVSRANLAERLQERPQKRIGRLPLPDEELVAQIKAVIGILPTYGYRRIHAILERQAPAAGSKPPNRKRVYWGMGRPVACCSIVMLAVVERRHDGRVAVDERNRRGSSDDFAFGCDNGERERVAFALGLEPTTTPIESLQSNEIAEAFVRPHDQTRLCPRLSQTQCRVRDASWIAH